MDAAATIKRIIDAATFRRPVYVWMQFESNATGDAIVIVALTSFVLGLLAGVSFSITGVISRVISALVAWLLIAALTWAAARFLFNAHGEYAPVLRVAGFGFPTLLLLIFTVRAFQNTLGVLLGVAWFIAVMAAGTREVMELTREQAWGSALAGFGGWVMLQAILGGGGFL